MAMPRAASPADGAPQAKPFFRFKLNNIDNYQTTPSVLDYPVILSKTTAPGKKIRAQLPVIRVFGSTETGQKVCAHIHGAFPYLYVEYKGSLEPDKVMKYIATLHRSLDDALCTALNRNPLDPKNVFIARITLCKGIPFFGFQVGYRHYLKIYSLQPRFMRRMTDILRSAGVMGTKLQPYESHLQFLPQFMIDYNLYGCGWVECKSVGFRSPLPGVESEEAGHEWHEGTIPKRLRLPEGKEEFIRSSYCTLEVDIQAHDIMNRWEVQLRPLHHDFVERLNPYNPNTKLLPSMAELWRDETRRRKEQGLPSEGFGVSWSAEARQTHGGWIHEPEYREKVNEMIALEQAMGDGQDVQFDTFVKNPDLQEKIKTTWETVEDFYPNNDQMRYTQADLNDVVVQIDDKQFIYEKETIDEERKLGGEEDVPGPNTEEAARARRMLPIITEEVLPDYGVMRDADFAAWSWKSHNFNLPISMFSRFRDSRLEGMLARKAGIKSSQDDKKMNKEKHGLNEVEGLTTKTPGSILKSAIKSPSKPGSFSPKTPGRVSFVEPSSQIPEGEDTPHGPRVQTQLKLMQSSMKSFQYPVVKDLGPDTIRRLSQDSSSQKSSPPKSSMQSPIKSGQSRKSSVSFGGSTVMSAFDSQILQEKQLVRLSNDIQQTFQTRRRQWVFNEMPLSTPEATNMDEHGLPQMVYQEAYYSSEKDVPERPREYAGREFRLKSNTVAFLPDFDPFGNGEGIVSSTKSKGKRPVKSARQKVWEFSSAPPTRSEVEEWLEEERQTAVAKQKADETAEFPNRPMGDLSQIEGPTQKNKHGFKFTQKKKSSSVAHEVQHMSIMSLEIHVNSRGTLLPDPLEDTVSCIFYCFQSTEAEHLTQGLQEEYHYGILLVGTEAEAQRVRRLFTVDVDCYDEELDILTALSAIVRRLDPDIITGYECHKGSWGYLLERAKLKYEYDMVNELSRVNVSAFGRFGKDLDKWGDEHASNIKITGRHLINIWRVVRGELNLLQYSMENVVFHLLHRRIPKYSHKHLTQWYKSEKSNQISRLMKYFMTKVRTDLELLEVQELVMRTSEQARLLGVDFYSVFSRGSQFKVESLMFRIAKPECFVLLSPSAKQVAQQNGLECLPLVMEPQSNFYTSPVLVLDFTSLYPSVMIAYNYCYSTCLGRVLAWNGVNRLGFIEYKRQRRLLELLKDHINISPNGMMFLKPAIRKSLLAKMLAEILETRVMVKAGMKRDKGDKTLQQLLNNRQLALKLIANVTYGYTSASFSGRLPCAEIADAIVQTARETLEKAIALIHSVEKWGAEVVYGDTDSLFVHLPGRTKDEAFDIGQEITDAVTDVNPRPVKLKFEKVYLPCVLLAKKRYVGFKYEHRDQKEPDFDAKGIETVRRDGTPAEQKIEETALKTLFRSADLSQVKSYFQRQCGKIMAEKVSIQDFCFAKEVRLGSYSEKGLPPPGAQIATRKMMEDPRAEPQYGERVPYVIISGAPGSRLSDRSVPPEELLYNPHNALDAEYYISKNLIPPLERIFNLVGANVRSWYDEMPKYQRIRRLPPADSTKPSKKSTIESFMKSSSCIICGAKETVHSSGICAACLEDSATSLYKLNSRLAKEQDKVRKLESICRSCAGIAGREEIACESFDCPVFYRRTRGSAVLSAERGAIEPFLTMLEEKVEKEEREAAMEW